MAPLTLRWLLSGLVCGAILSFGLAWFVTRFGLLDPHRLDLLLLNCALASLNLLVVPWMYWWDKRRARLGTGQRIPEVVLHFFAFAGGALGAFCSQRLFHHKTRKRWFSVLTWTAMVGNVGLLYLGLTHFGLVT